MPKRNWTETLRFQFSRSPALCSAEKQSRRPSINDNNLAVSARSFAPYVPTMTNDVLDRLLISLAVRLHAFSTCRIQQGWRLAFGPLEAVTIHCVLQGTGSVRAGGKSWTSFGPGSVIIVPARVPHALGEASDAAVEVSGEDHCTLQNEAVVAFTAGNGSPDTLLLCGMIPETYDGALGLFSNLSTPMVQDLSEDEPSLHAFALMLAEVQEPSVGTQALTEALLKQCLILLLRRLLKSDPAGFDLLAGLGDARLVRAVTAIIEQPAAAHTVESLAQIAGMSRAAFAERFARSYERTPLDFVQTVRMRTAAQLLTMTDLPIKTIASSIGYASRSYFSRAFRAYYGLDPRSYREFAGQEEREPERVMDVSSQSTEFEAKLNPS